MFKKTTAVVEPYVVEAYRPPAAARVLALAQRSLSTLMDEQPMGIWAVARIEDDRYTLLAVESPAFPVEAGLHSELSDSVCSRMVQGGPPIASPLSDVPHYNDSPLVQQMVLRSYIGVPIYAGGRLIGSLCATSQAEMPELDPAERAALVRRVTAHATAIGEEFQQALDAEAIERALDWENAQRTQDDLTHLPDRRGWALLLSREEKRASTLAEAVGVVVVDLGQVTSAKHLVKAVEALREIAGPAVQMTRLGGRQFGLLLPDRTAREVESFVAEIGRGMSAGGVHAATGWAMRTPEEGLEGAWHRAMSHSFSARRDLLQAQSA
jgi:GGDEF domain-containing protein